jgi:curved DNA-binding protein CbpA
MGLALPWVAGMSSYYDVLGVSVDAGVEEIRRAYLRKAQLLHPDRYAGAPESERRRAEEGMKVLNEAWNTLKSAETRHRYDIEHQWDHLWDEAEAESPARPSLFRRAGVRLAIVVVIVAGLAGSGVVILSRPADHSRSWSPAATADLRSAAIHAGMTAPQADCFVRSITHRFAPSDGVDRSVIQEAFDSCRSP